MSDTTYDVIVVGGGPAGLTATLWLARSLRSVVMIDSGDPRNWETRGIHGYLGLHGITPPALRQRGRDECRQFGATLVDAAVHNVECVDENRFRATLANGMTLSASRLLLAIGIVDEWPDVPGLERAYGATVHVCPDCDGYEARDTKTVVIGSGRKAVGMALALTTWTREIVVCTNGAPADLTPELLAKLEALNIPVLEVPIDCARSANGAVYALELAGGMCLDCERIFFALGQAPADDLGSQLGCERDEIGRIVTDQHYHTSVQNVYAAGDVIHGPQLALAAAASGAIAALAIHHSLLPEGRKLS